MVLTMDDTDKANEHGRWKVCACNVRWTRRKVVRVVSGRAQRVDDGHEQLAPGARWMGWDG